MFYTSPVVGAAEGGALPPAARLASRISVLCVCVLFTLSLTTG